MNGNQPTTWRIDVADEAGTRKIADDVSGLVKPGDLVTLSGDLGAGKTAFARALVRRLSGDPDLEVPSPTFTLMQVYEALDFPIVHADLYRIGNPSELAELGWDEATDSALVLVEWADRAGGALPDERLDVRLTIPPEGGEKRIIELSVFGAFATRIARAKGATEILRAAGWQDATRAFMLGDQVCMKRDNAIEALNVLAAISSQ